MFTSSFEKNLIRRYLIWAYKSTRESFERIERKTTQLKVDEYIIKDLNKSRQKYPKAYQKSIEEFSLYIDNKKKEESTQKYEDTKTKRLHPQYLYLKNRLSTIEGAIKHFLGKKALKEIEQLYEKEFIQRILQARDH